MYFQFGWPKTLNTAVIDAGEIIEIRRHPLKQLIFTLTRKSLLVWHTRFQVVVGCYKGPKGQSDYSNIVLRLDGGGVAITDGQGHLFILEVSFKGSQGAHGCPHCPQYRAKLLYGDSEQLRCGCEVTAVQFELTAHKVIPGGISSIICFHDYFLVSTGSNKLHLFNWLGVSEKSGGCVLVSSLNVASDLLPQSSAHQLQDEDVAIADMVDCSKLDALVALFSDGRVACFIPTSSPNFSLSSLLGVWIPDVQDGCRIAINGTYRLISVGRLSGVVDVFSLDESTGAWFLSHTFSLPGDQFPGGEDSLGAVSQLSWSHGDEMAVAVSWDEGGLAIWSVFGYLISFSLGPKPDMTPTPKKTSGTKLRALCWSRDGYGLWMAPHSGGRDKPGIKKGCVVYLLNFLKNAIVNNPTVTNHHHIMLQGPDRLHLLVSNSLIANGNRGRAQEIGSVIASTPHWRIVQVPESYLGLNWPLKYSCVDYSGRYIATAGKAGLALYSCITHKWKLFSNEQQEQSVVCCGGLVWWRDIVVFPCVASKSAVEVRFYSLHSKLDTSQYLYTLNMLSPLAKINLHGNHLLVLTTNGTLFIYHLSLNMEPQTSGATLKISKYYEASLSHSVPRVHLAISAMTSTLRAEPNKTLDPGEESGSEEDLESVLLNMSGKILMIHRLSTVTTETGRKKVTFGSAVCLASQVEAVWAPPPEKEGHQCSHMTQSLWLHCGSLGLKVWLPLFPHDNPHPTFLSKRIMLSVDTTVYPQVVLFKESAILGLSHETQVFTELSSPTHSAAIFPYSTVERAIQLCLHPILRQLLKRNLGTHALQLAQGYCHLPYFAHVLECMLHEVLEEEAPANLPLPDPLLPQVVQFIRQFPQFHTTVSSCARKTEVALWRYLFAAVGKPRDLFEICIKSGNLATAATYLIIIQNLETSAVSRKLATRLLECALEAGLWELANNLIRYLQAIGGGEVSLATPKTVTPGTPFSASGPLSSDSVGVVKTPEDCETEEPKSFARPQFVVDTNTKVEYFIDLLLGRHARKLLTACQVRELGKFAANVDFDLASWLAKESDAIVLTRSVEGVELEIFKYLLPYWMGLENNSHSVPLGSHRRRTRAGRVEDFVAALLSLHQQFSWPLPTGPQSSAYQVRTPCDGAPSTCLKYDSETKCSSAEDTNEESPRSSVNRSFRPPDLDLKDVSAIQTPPTDQVTASVTEVELKEIKHSENLTSPWQQRHSSSTSDLDQVNNIPVSASVRDATWLLRLPSKPPEQSENELRYLAQVMLSARCLEWSLVVAILLQDGRLLQDIVSILDELVHIDMASHVATANQLSYHLAVFQEWASSECVTDDMPSQTLNNYPNNQYCPGYKKLDNQLSAMSQSIAHLIKCKDLNTSNSPVRGEENTNPYTEQNTILSEHNESEDKDNPEAVLDHPPREQAQDTCVVS